MLDPFNEIVDESITQLVKEGQMSERQRLLTDMLAAVLVNPPAVTVDERTGDLIAEEFSIGCEQVDRPRIGGTVKGDSFQVYNPVGEEVGKETGLFSEACKQLVCTIANERMQRLLDDMSTEALAREWQQ